MAQRNHQNVCKARLKLNDSNSDCFWARSQVQTLSRFEVKMCLLSYSQCQRLACNLFQLSLIFWAVKPCTHHNCSEFPHGVFGVWPQSLPGVFFSHGTHFSIEISICFIVFLHIFGWNVNSGSHLTKSLSAWSSSNAWHVALLQLVQTVGDPLSLSSQNRVSLLRRKPIGVPNLE